ncbi:formate transporter FocA [Corallincola holothuriorum]|uniref:Formate transporter FocA n=1 Tax=Corallincola holothuriorum TaxID=2282215 RepID=A0A368NHF7_9GAMM|nr:formate transporter FocA [Corallincola holothuriorum]RCU50027.1 formate transporter FocA [Corallincola holothuriorum]
MKLIENKSETAGLELPERMTQTAEQYGYKKVVKAPATSIALAVTAGIFIGLAFIFYITVTTGNHEASWGLSRLVGGFAFSIGLVLIVICGGELFTSTVLTSIARASKRISHRQQLACWGRVYLGNFVGALVLVALVYSAKLYMLDSGQWGVNALQIAQHKLHHGFGQAVALGVLCNMLVCLGIWMTFSSEDVLTKALLVVLPVALFVSTGFEHCVANMFMVPLAIAIKSGAGPDFWAATGMSAQAFSDLTFSNFIFNNLIPVTLGNIIGGAMFVGLTYWGIYRRPTLKSESKIVNHLDKIKGTTIMKNSNVTLQVKEFMHAPTASLTESTNLMDALTAMLSLHQTGMPVVNSNHQLVGFISEHDLLRELWLADYELSAEKTVGSIMRREVATVAPGDCLIKLAEFISVDREKVYPVTDSGFVLSYKAQSLEERLAEADVSRPKIYPVVENGVLVGTISRTDIMYAFFKACGGKDDSLHSKVTHQAA